MPTPHISAPDGAFAEAVLLPGDPLRAAYIAETFLDDPEQVTGVRNMLGFTGAYQAMPVSVMGTGMGMPSASIYVTELIRQYGCRRLVRVGSCGGIATEAGLRSVIVATAASTDSIANRLRYGGWDYAAAADFGLAAAAVEAAGAAGVEVHTGIVHSSDFFYNPVGGAMEIWQRMGVLAVEMETSALYAIAAEEGARALSVLTVSDHLVTEETTTPEERERTFDEMVRIALAALATDAG